MISVSNRRLKEPQKFYFEENWNRNNSVTLFQALWEERHYLLLITVSEKLFGFLASIAPSLRIQVVKQQM